MYKLLALDIDHTILKSDSSLPQEVKKAINRCEDEGIKLFLASGRGANGVMLYKERLGVESAYCCADNGASIFSDLENIRFPKAIPQEDAKQIILSMKALGIETIVSSKGKLYYEEMSDEMARFMTLFNDDMEVVQAKDIWKMPQIYKICVKLPSRELFKEAEKAATKNAPFCQGYTNFGDYNPAGVSKGTALLELMNTLGIKKEEVAAAGDADNDIPLICEAGLACAMGNGTKRLKAAADVILPSCDEMGVKYLIENYILP